MDIGANLVSILGTIFNFLSTIVQLRELGKKVPDEEKLKLLRASAALVQQLKLCKDVHHSFYFFGAGPLRQFDNQTRQDFGDQGLLFRLIDDNMAGEDNRELWVALTSRFKRYWHLVERYSARQMNSVLTRARRTKTPALTTAQWVNSPSKEVENVVKDLVQEFAEMLQCIEDFRGLFKKITTAAVSENPDRVKMVPSLLKDLEDKAEDVVIHADDAIVASVGILAYVNEMAFPGGSRQ